MTATTTAHETREAWLVAAIAALAPMFTELGHDVPAVRVSVGFPGGRGNRASVIGQCWHGTAAEDGVGQIFVSHVLGDAVRVLDVLAHEMVHAVNHAAGETGHGRPFAKIAKALGLEGKMTATVAGEALKAKLGEIAAEMGEYPHAALTTAVASVKKQGTRQLKVECPSGSGYKVRMTRQWLDEVGAPICPCHNETMEEAAS
jgi:hypothetical protein